MWMWQVRQRKVQLENNEGNSRTLQLLKNGFDYIYSLQSETL